MCMTYVKKELQGKVFKIRLQFDAPLSKSKSDLHTGILSIVKLEQSAVVGGAVGCSRKAPRNSTSIIAVRGTSTMLDVLATCLKSERDLNSEFCHSNK